MIGRARHPCVRRESSKRVRLIQILFSGLEAAVPVDTPKPNAWERRGVWYSAENIVPSATAFSVGVGWGRTSLPRGFAGGKGLDIGGGQ